jgi:formamidopyrimidine-DNA glycosylase
VFFNMAFMLVSSFLMQATITTLGDLPACKNCWRDSGMAAGDGKAFFGYHLLPPPAAKRRMFRALSGLSVLDGCLTIRRMALSGVSMPELPEVEITCRGIRPHVEGRTLTAVVTRNARLRLPVPVELAERLAGQRLVRVGRRAKYLLFDFAAGGSLIAHLGMSGSLRVVEALEAAGRHDHLDLVFGAHALRLRDPRRFGLVSWHPGAALAHPLLARLGPEPLDGAFDGDWLYRASRGLRAAVKHVLMDARRVAGIGNIYASESLFRARIHPLMAAGRIEAAQYARLAREVKATLADAIEAGGSTLRDFVGGDGKPGYFQLQYFVYGRDGEACRVCGGQIERVVSGQRATFFCPRCQRQD